MGITISDIAKICHVSRGTVDRALNGRTGIKESTRDQILQIAQQNGYTPNSIARGLVTGKTNTVGIIVFDFRNRHFAQFLNSIQDRLAEIGYTSYVCTSEKEKKREAEIVREMISRNVEGIIIIPIHPPEEFDTLFPSLHIPVVAFSNRLSSRFSYVGADFARASYVAMEAFYRKGYRYVSFIGPCAVFDKTINAYAQTERAAGYLNFLKDHPDMHGEMITSYDYMDQILTDLKTISHPGYLCSSDYYALQILLNAKKSGLRIPEDFGMMGYDGIDTLDYVDPPLSTVVYPIEKVGYETIRLLDQQMHGRPDPQDVFIDLRLSDGASV